MNVRLQEQYIFIASRSDNKFSISYLALKYSCFVYYSMCTDSQLALVLDTLYMDSYGWLISVTLVTHYETRTCRIQKILGVKYKLGFLTDQNVLESYQTSFCTRN